jgi:HEAT repeat protein
MGDARAVKPLQKTLQTDEKGVRESVARALGEIGNDDAVDVLIDCLKGDPDYVVQAAAASALGSAGNKLAVEPLIESLGKCEPYVRSQSAKALGDLGDRAAVEPLIKALEDEEYFVKNAAAIALCKIGDKRGLKPLIEKGGKQPIRLAAKIGDFDSVRYLTRY